MLPTRQGSFRLFRLAGVDVFLHWSWFIVAAYWISQGYHSSLLWNILDYLALFMIVLMHEFGHALACRSVGGQANQIVLWPLGGVAYVAPPPRPGAILWSIAAGPLVNVILLPILTVALFMAKSWGDPGVTSDFVLFLRTICYTNVALLIFNLLPIYPLDGGQILQSLLWFVVGRARSLMIVSIIGFAGGGVLILLAIFLFKSIWIGIMCLFIFMNCLRGLTQARALARLADAPHHDGYRCPACDANPPRGDLWFCGNCKNKFDVFTSRSICPNCGAQFPLIGCPNCGKNSSIAEWSPTPTPPPVPPA